jgi:hypothetical protein
MVEAATQRLSRSALLTLVAIVMMAAGVRLWGLAFGLPFGNARPDETYVMDVVRPLLEGRAPPPNYEYPWLYMGLTGLGWLGYYIVGAVQGSFASLADLTASWRTHYTPFFLINRGISAALGVATVLVVFAIARRLWNVRAGLVAAACLALAYLHVRDSHYATTDVPMTFFAMLATWLTLRAFDRGWVGDYVWAGLAGGLAGATKYNAVFVVVPLVVSALGHAVRIGPAAGFTRLVAAAVPCGVVAALGVPFAFSDPAGFQRVLSLLFTSTTTGQTHLDLPPGWVTHLQYSLRYGVGLAMLIAAAAGAARALVGDPWRVAVVLAFPLSYFAVVGAARNQYFRYALPLVPFLCLTAACAVDGVASWLARPGRSRAWIPVGAAAGLTALLVAEPAWRSWQFDRLMATTDNRVVAAEWIAAHVPAGSALLTTGSHYGFPWLPADRRYRYWVWDRREQVYWSPEDDAPRPEWILRQEHALSSDQPVIAGWLAEDYAVAWRFDATRGGAAAIYDRMDAFYLPYAGFTGVSRPGPSFTLYRRAR